MLNSIIIRCIYLMYDKSSMFYTLFSNLCALFSLTSFFWSSLHLFLLVFFQLGWTRLSKENGRHLRILRWCLVLCWNLALILTFTTQLMTCYTRDRVCDSLYNCIVRMYQNHNQLCHKLLLGGHKESLNMQDTSTALG